MPKEERYARGMTERGSVKESCREMPEFHFARKAATNGRKSTAIGASKVDGEIGGRGSSHNRVISAWRDRGPAVDVADVRKGDPQGQVLAAGGEPIAAAERERRARRNEQIVLD